MYVNMFIGSRINVGEVAGTHGGDGPGDRLPVEREGRDHRQSERRAARSPCRCVCPIARPARCTRRRREVKGSSSSRVNGAPLEAHYRARLRRDHARVEGAAIESTSSCRCTPQRITADEPSRPRAARWRFDTARCSTTSSLRTSRASIAQSGSAAHRGMARGFVRRRGHAQREMGRRLGAHGRAEFCAHESRRNLRARVSDGCAARQGVFAGVDEGLDGVRPRQKRPGRLFAGPALIRSVPVC